MAKMTVDQLQIFLAVAQCLHFTRAADELYLTQASVSTAIQSLERHYKVKLFHRIGRRVELTDAGKVLQTQAQRIIAEVETAERQLLEFNNLQQGELKIGASQTIGNYWLPKFISQFQQHYPGIRVDCTLSNTHDVSAGVVAGFFDLGLVEGQVDASILPLLSGRTVGSHHLRIIVGQSHPWFTQGSVAMAEILNTAWILREPGSGTRQRFEQVLKQLGVEPSALDVVAEMKSAAMVKSATESGKAATVLSELSILKERQLDTLRPIQLIGVQNLEVLNPAILILKEN
ncbi:MAG: LysR substrate-binding domain-containing protein [Rhizonema sp. PD38]|nr:LysR substrate-binding domain-containing protein [Rhizonema sp. PD38]